MGCIFYKQFHKVSQMPAPTDETTHVKTIFQVLPNTLQPVLRKLFKREYRPVEFN